LARSADQAVWEAASATAADWLMLINYSLIFALLLLFSGLVLDAGMLEWTALHLQTAADAAAQEGMYELARGNAAWATAGKAQATLIGYTNGVAGGLVTLVNPPVSGPYAGDHLAVQATVTQAATNLFMELVNGGKSTVARSAVARVLPTCIWIMNPSSSNAYGQIQIESAGLRPTTCGIYINTRSGGNLRVDGFGILTTSRIRIVGPSSGDGSAGSVWPAPIFGAAQKNDPLAYVTAPTFVSCTYSSMSVTGGTYQVSPGTYCGFTASNVTINFDPGLYIFTGGLTLQNNSTLNGSGVTLYFTAGGGFGYGTVNITNSALNLTAPTSSSAGGIAGVLMFSDRNWVDHGNQDFKIQNSTLLTDGIWYLPNIGLYLWQCGNFQGTHYLGLVIDNFFQFNGNTYGSADYSTLPGGSPYHYEDGVLVQ
jgi:hypothetical protein